MSVVPETRRKAIESGSGISWADWLSFFEPHKELDHKALALEALSNIQSVGASKSPEWWAQMVTVAYEQHIGRRGIGERCDGTFSASVSKTLPGTMDEVLVKVVAAVKDLDEYAGVPAASAPSTSETEKWRYWRVKLADGSKVTINIQQKPGGEKSSASVNHDDLASSDLIDASKAWWRSFLTNL